MKSEHDADYHSWHFAPELIIPVCSPSYLAQHKPLLGVPGESGHTLLHLSDAHFDPKTLWGATTTPIARHALLEFSDYAVVVQAALSGGGVGPGRGSAVARVLVGGTLVPASAPAGRA